MSLSSTTAWEQNLRALTTQACQAAEQGRWDRVEECYRLRGEYLRDHPLPRTLATDLIAFDGEVAARIVQVRLAIQSQVMETAKIRQNLQGLRSWQREREAAHALMDQLA